MGAPAAIRLFSGVLIGRPMADRGRLVGFFAGLPPEVQAWLADNGFVEPSAPQSLAYAPVVGGAHALLIAPTGMGKTEAALLPIVERLLKGPAYSAGFRLLYITPLRALNRDMLRRMTSLGERTGLRVGVRHGDTTPYERARQSRDPPAILITTPETLQLLFTGRNLRSHLRAVEAVVVDEIHELAEDERGAQLAVALERLVELCGREFQRVGLSATVGAPEEVAHFLAGNGRPVETLRVDLPKAIEVRVSAPPPPPPDDPATAAWCERLRVPPPVVAALMECIRVIKGHHQVLLFVNTRDTAELLATRLSLIDPELRLGIHHGSLARDVRIEMENEFKAGRLRALVCTSSLELGIDIGTVDFVVQYNSPREVARLLQRVGRGSHRIAATSRGLILTSNFDDVAESAVLAALSGKGAIERKLVRECPLGVLANQLIAMANSEVRVEADRAFATVRRAYPFRSLPRAAFDATVALIADLGAVRSAGSSFSKRGGTPVYFFENISMIPDSRTYAVIDIVSRKFIGTLDEAFVATFDEENSKFIVKGRSWRVAEVGEDSVLVEPSDDLGAVPSWIGEDIPVPFAVAQGVGERRRAGFLDGPEVDPDAKLAFSAMVAAQRAGGFAVPDERTVVIERAERTIILNACFGSRVNETIGRALTGLLTQRLGATVGLFTDPYRIVLTLPRALRERDIEAALRTLSPAGLEEFMRLVLRSSALLKWNLLHSAKKFAALRKGADHRFVSAKALLERFASTPLVDDAIDRALHDRLDVVRTAHVLQGLHDGSISVVHQALSPIGAAGGERMRELVAPQRPDAAILAALRRRLEDSRVALVCLACRKLRTVTVRDARPEAGCPHCSGRMLGVLHPRERDSASLLARKARSPQEEKRKRQLGTTASLVAAHGRRALLALAARGVGPDSAGRILTRQQESEEDLLKDILAAEVLYARTRRFWG